MGSRGAAGFRQTREHEYGGKRHGPGRERRADRCHGRPMRLTLEQESVDAWWLSLDLNTDYFSTQWCRSFVRQMKVCMEELAHRPLSLVIKSPAAAREARTPSFSATAGETKLATEAA